MAERKKVELTFRQWVICYLGSLGLGGLAWWGTGSPWIGGGVLVAFTAVYVFWLAGKFAPAKTTPGSPEGLSRQQRREMERKGKM